MLPVVTPQILSQTHETDFNGAKYAIKFAPDPVFSGCSANKHWNLLTKLNMLINLLSAKQIANLLTNLLTNLQSAKHIKKSVNKYLQSVTNSVNKFAICLANYLVSKFC